MSSTGLLKDIFYVHWHDINRSCRLDLQISEGCYLASHDKMNDDACAPSGQFAGTTEQVDLPGVVVLQKYVQHSDGTCAPSMLPRKEIDFSKECDCLCTAIINDLQPASDN